MHSVLNRTYIEEYTTIGPYMNFDSCTNKDPIKIPFQSEWIDEHGLISGLYEWSKVNLKEGDSFISYTPGFGLEQNLGRNLPILISKNHKGLIRIRADLLFGQCFLLTDRRMKVFTKEKIDNINAQKTDIEYIPFECKKKIIWVESTDSLNKFVKEKDCFPVYLNDLLKFLSHCINAVYNKNDTRHQIKDIGSKWVSDLKLPTDQAIECTKVHKRLSRYITNELSFIQMQDSIENFSVLLKMWLETANCILTE